MVGERVSRRRVLGGYWRSRYDRSLAGAGADPLALLPTGVPTTSVHAAGDDLVPISQSATYVRAAGPDARLARVPGGHFEHLDPQSQACGAMREALA